jgi:hypothetical protein
MTIRLNITDGEGVLLGTIELTEDELRRARTSASSTATSTAARWVGPLGPPPSSATRTKSS